ncbi:polysaccharide deacetylase family protein [Clostridium gasigenes]|uniref:polysaccharide deacetylase family protein n=1 Tax=Clostridium gasigenes TaxID=94869 RepID=UPI001C0C7B2A|nr:polysaccharide deacetylase family protein [Clostridium gasigenes]MBU3107484.1 polysaccharide deacetylase family protein [Clostridium gasigenes]
MLNLKKSLKFKLSMSLLSLLLLLNLTSPTSIFASTNSNYSIKILDAKTDKIVYTQNDKITVTVQVKNSGTITLPGLWADVWVDKKPISFLNTDPKYHDSTYVDSTKTFGVLTAYMPDPNPVYNPVPNEFVPGPIKPGEVKTLTFTYPSTGEYTKIQDYTVRAYPWNPALGKNLNGLIQDSTKKYGEADSFKAKYAIEGYKALASYPNNKNAALVLRVDDVKTGTDQSVVDLLAVMDKHSAKGSFMIMNGGAQDSKVSLTNAIKNGHEIGLHGTDHMTTLSAENYVPEAKVHGHQPPVTWHEFEGPHFKGLAYDEQFRRLKSCYDDIVTNFNVKPVSFSAPQVGLSENTIAALTNLGGKYSSNFVGDKPGFAYHNVIEVPYLGDYTWDVNKTNYNESLEAACRDLDRIVSEGGVMTLILHTIRHTADNPERTQWLNDFLTYADTKNVWYSTIKDVGGWFEQSNKEIVPVSQIPGGIEYLAERQK